MIYIFAFITLHCYSVLSASNLFHIQTSNALYKHFVSQSMLAYGSTMQKYDTIKR